MRSALEAKAAAYGPDDRLTALAHAGLGNVLWSIGKDDEAHEEHRRALAIPPLG